MEAIAGLGLSIHFSARVDMHEVQVIENKITKWGANGAIDEAQIRHLLGGGDESGGTAASKA